MNLSIQPCRAAIWKAKVQLDLKLARDVKVNKKNLCYYLLFKKTHKQLFSKRAEGSQKTVIHKHRWNS